MVLTGQFEFCGQDLYVVGARKFVLVGLGLLGCTPNAIYTHGTSGSCFDEENAATFIFNNKLKSLVDFFNGKLSADSKFIFINSTAVALANSNAPGNNFAFLILQHHISRLKKKKNN